MNALKIAVWIMVVASPAMAHHDKTPLREAVVDGHTHDVGGATFWLAGAAVAMIIALIAVQKSVFRK
ncbi:hypothetical protein ALP8811_01096 [Aliiroseovarius pelagivivens]|uniref:Uncharacterized protein n=1 Tax=Aliiroseovarius pelagivivens TaxID=1639690 RepID=A0A2R8AJ84_9RHOB|nr:hypothetical protein [Aliiroseovarius pelagivivens]SPF76096.1 hypothetical protein ALP8811_01096 [Aliiroseovarius pelagivivens]